MNERISFSVDMDAHCDECGKEGQCGNGLCLSCTEKAITGKPMKSATGKAVAKRGMIVGVTNKVDNGNEVEKENRYLKYVFTDDEIKSMSYELARENRELRALNERKKEIMASIASEIKAKEGTVDRISERISNGHEYRYVDCEVIMDDPEPGTKSVTRSDTGEITYEPMKDYELQRKLPLDK